MRVYVHVYIYIHTHNYIYCIQLYASSSFWMGRIVTKHRVQIKVEGNHRHNRMTGVLNRRDGDCARFCGGFVFATCFRTADGSTERRLEKRKVQSQKCLPYFLRCHQPQDIVIFSVLQDGRRRTKGQICIYTVYPSEFLSRASVPLMNKRTHEENRSE